MPVLLKQLGYLAAMLVLACALVVLRQHHTQSIHYSFLYWNLFLAFLPLLMSLPLLKASHGKWGLWVWPVLGCWLLFFPNAPYLISDLMHIYLPSPMPRWYDPLMLATAAFSGVYSGFLSLWIVEQFLRQRWPNWGVNLSIALIWLLTGLGIYLGRIPRWNSWDLFNRPEALFADILGLLLNPSDNPEAVALIALYSLFLLVNYAFWRSLAPIQRPRASGAEEGALL